MVELGGALHLSSPVYETVWLPRQETLARCRGEAWTWCSHAAPAEDCRCGLYAARSPAQAAALLAERRWARAHHLQAALGRVSLWGSVVECEQGWRGERAYPAALYLPALAPEASGRRLGRFLPRRWDAFLPAPDVVRELSAYGVAVELIACRTLAELADTLAADPSLSLESASG